MPTAANPGARPDVGVTPEKTSIAPSTTAKAERTSGTSAIVPRASAAFAAGRASDLGDRERDHGHGQWHDVVDDAVKQQRADQPVERQPGAAARRE